MAWAAGILEGEACFLLVNDHGRLRPVVRVSMTDEDVIRRLRDILGVGYVISQRPPSMPEHQRTRWVLGIDRQKEAYAIMMAVYSWLGERRRQRINEVVSAWIRQGVYVRGARRRQRRRRRVVRTQGLASSWQ
jgi:hypothetical protein